MPNYKPKRTAAANRAASSLRSRAARISVNEIGQNYCDLSCPAGILSRSSCDSANRLDLRREIANSQFVLSHSSKRDVAILDSASRTVLMCWLSCTNFAIFPGS